MYRVFINITTCHGNKLAPQSISRSPYSICSQFFFTVFDFIHTDDFQFMMQFLLCMRVRHRYASLCGYWLNNSQLKITSLLCVHCLPAKFTFLNWNPSRRETTFGMFKGECFFAHSTCNLLCYLTKQTSKQIKHAHSIFLSASVTFSTPFQSMTC